MENTIISDKREVENKIRRIRKEDLKNLHVVSDTGYFIYCNGRTDVEKFDGKLEFDITPIPYVGDDSWVEDFIHEIKRTLESQKVPEADPECDFCNYRKQVKKLLS